MVSAGQVAGTLGCVARRRKIGGPGYHLLRCKSLMQRPLLFFMLSIGAFFPPSLRRRSNFARLRHSALLRVMNLRKKFCVLKIEAIANAKLKLGYMGESRESVLNACFTSLGRKSLNNFGDRWSGEGGETDTKVENSERVFNPNGGEFSVALYTFAPLHPATLNSAIEHYIKSMVKNWLN